MENKKKLQEEELAEVTGAGTGDSSSDSEGKDGKYPSPRLPIL